MISENYLSVHIFIIIRDDVSVLKHTILGREKIIMSMELFITDDCN